jgi:photosystem II stability/assembly factor-like uncharacterized protein
MKHTITLFLWLLLLSTSFEGDGTKGWHQINFPMQNVLITDICFLDSLRGWAVANDNDPTDTVYIFETTDGGNSWSVQYSDSLRVLNTIQFVNPGTGYASGGFGDAAIIKTTNSGDTWIKTNPGPFYSVSDLYFVNPDTGWICSDEQLDGGIFRTTNGGASWQRQVQPLLGYRHLDFLNKDTGWCLVNDGKVFKTNNSGLDWLEISRVTLAALKEDIRFVDHSTGWILNGQPFMQGIFKSTNGGQNWFTQYDPTFDNGWPTSITILSKKKGWVAKTRNIVAMIDENTWGAQTLPMSFPSLRSIDYVDSNIVYAAGGVILKTTDGGGPITSIRNEANQLSESYSLIRNYPNPFNSQTLVRYLIKEPGLVSIEVFDIAGKLVSSPLKDAMTSAGEHEIIFDAQTLASGVYICVMKAISRTGKESYSGTVRMLLVK